MPSAGARDCRRRPSAGARASPSRSRRPDRPEPVADGRERAGAARTTAAGEPEPDGRRRAGVRRWPARPSQEAADAAPVEMETFYVFTRGARRRPERGPREARKSAAPPASGAPREGGKPEGERREGRRAAGPSATASRARARRIAASRAGTRPGPRQAQGQVGRRPRRRRRSRARKADRSRQSVRGPDGAQDAGLSRAGWNPARPIRLDKWLWQARLCKTRGLAARVIEDGACGSMRRAWSSPRRRCGSATA